MFTEMEQKSPTVFVTIKPSITPPTIPPPKIIQTERHPITGCLSKKSKPEIPTRCAWAYFPFFSEVSFIAFFSTSGVMAAFAAFIASSGTNFNTVPLMQ